MVMLRDEFEEVLVDGSLYMDGFIALLAEVLKTVAAEKDAWVSVHGSFFGQSGVNIFWSFHAFWFFKFLCWRGVHGSFKAPRTQAWPRDPRNRFEKIIF